MSRILLSTAYEADLHMDDSFDELIYFPVRKGRGGEGGGGRGRHTLLLVLWLVVGSLACPVNGGGIRVGTHTLLLLLSRHDHPHL